VAGPVFGPEPAVAVRPPAPPAAVVLPGPPGDIEGSLPDPVGAVVPLAADSGIAAASGAGGAVGSATPPSAPDPAPGRAKFDGDEI
jgi:hypothetical protein